MNETVNTTGAFEQLIDHLDDTLEAMQSHAHARIDQGAFDTAQQVLKQAQSVKSLRDDLEAMSDRYAETIASVQGIKGTVKLPKGLKTRQQAYRVPILKALVALGGQAKIGQVLDRVFAEMQSRLNSYDLANLPQSDTPRWRNTAQWARNSLREDGMIRGDTPRGIWAISEKGRKWVAKNAG